MKWKQAEALNRQFQRAFSEGKSYTREEFAAKCGMPLNQFPILNSVDITEPGVTKLLHALQPAKVPGPDGITTTVLKELAEVPHSHYHLSVVLGHWHITIWLEGCKRNTSIQERGTLRSSKL